MRRKLNTTRATPKKYINDGGSIWVPSSFCSSTIPPQSVTAMYATKQIEKITRTSMTSRPEDAVTENGMKRLRDLLNGPSPTLNFVRKASLFHESKRRIATSFAVCLPSLPNAPFPLEKKGVEISSVRGAPHTHPTPSIAEAFSAIMITGRFVFARVTQGMMEASATQRPSTPTTRQCSSTTASGSPAAPIRHVPDGW